MTLSGDPEVEISEARLSKVVGNSAYADARREMAVQILNDGKKLHKPLETAAGQLTETFNGSPTRPDGAALTKVSQKSLAKDVKGTLDESFSAIESQIDANVARSVRRSAQAMSETLAGMGMPSLTRTQLEAVRKKMEGYKTEEFRGATLQDRLAVQKRRSFEHAMDTVTKARVGGIETNREKVASDLSKSIADKSLGTTRVEGGSTYKRVQLINTAEQIRKANDAALEVLRVAEVPLAYWRLSGIHKHEHGKEICEQLATNKSQETIDYLQKLGVNIANVDLEGLYLVEDYPLMPHPNCMCSPEPFYPEEVRVAKASAELQVEAAADLPEEFMPVGSADTLVQDATVSSLNSMAVEFGLPGDFTRETVQAFGAEGSATLLAERLRRTGRIQEAQAVVGRVLERELPNIGKRLESVVGKIERDIDTIKANSILAEKTQAHQIANKLAQIQAENVTAYANVRSLTNLSRAIEERPVLRSRVMGSKEEVIRRMSRFGLPSAQYKVLTKGGRYWAEVTNEGMQKTAKVVFQTKPETSAAVAKIKSGAGFKPRQPKGVVKKLHGQNEFKLDDAQSRSVALIEKQKNVMLHLAAGLGKTPMLVTSVSDLKAQGKIERAAIGVPAGLRAQFVTETLSFNAKDQVTYYLPAADVKRVRAEVRNSLVAEWSGSNRKAYPDPAKLKAEAEKWADEQMGRLTMVGIPKGTDSAKLDEMVRGSKSTFHIFSHDDMAANAKVIRKNFDYVAVDEAHQMTSPSSESGSYKSQRLGEIVGGRVQYKVAMTGTASRNNVGELYDIVNWVDPGRLPDKATFMQKYRFLTLESNLFEQQLVKALRTDIDAISYTRSSPILGKVQLNSPFTEVAYTREEIAEKAKARLWRLIERGPPANPARLAKYEASLAEARAALAQEKFKQRDVSPEDSDHLVRVKMTRTQKARSKEIESEFRQLKKAQEARTPNQKSAAEGRLSEAKAELQRLVDKGDATEYEPQADRTARLARMSRLRNRIDELNRVANPEAWRDNQHFKNVHGSVGTDVTPRLAEKKSVQAKLQATGESTAKVQAVLELMGEGGRLEGRRPLIHLERLDSAYTVKEALRQQGIEAVIYDGSLSMQERQQIKREFNNGKWGALIATRAGSTGLNLQAGSDATIHYDMPYSYAEYAQREARNWRQKQQNSVDSFVLFQDDSPQDLRRLDILKSKRKVLGAIDELSAVDDDASVVSKFLGTATKPQITRYAEYAAKHGERRGREFLTELRKHIQETSDASDIGTLVQKMLEASQ